MGASAAGPPASAIPDVVNRDREIQPSPQVNPAITSGAERRTPAVQPRDFTARESAGAAARRSVNRPIMPQSGGRVESDPSSAGSVIVTPRSERFSAPTRSGVPSTVRGRLSSSAALRSTRDLPAVRPCRVRAVHRRCVRYRDRPRRRDSHPDEVRLPAPCSAAATAMRWDPHGLRPWDPVVDPCRAGAVGGEPDVAAISPHANHMFFPWL